MRNLILLLLTIIPLTMVSCSKPNDEKFDIDISNFKSIKTNKSTIESKNITVDQENKLFIKNLVTPKTKDQILSNTKFGKKDPFSKGDLKINLINSNLRLTGFLNTETNKYALIKYLDITGTLTEESIGGINTNLLPNGAKVIKIDPKNQKLIISFNNENFIFEL